MDSVFYKDEIYKPTDILDILSKLSEHSLTEKNNNVQYYDIPCGFDIETTSFYAKDEKRAIMYEWTFGIDGYIIIGRKWEEFLYVLDTIRNHFKLDTSKRIIVGVHNLAFEFQFMRKWFIWDKVFSLDTRKPVYAITNGIEFRCTYILTGYSLEKVAEDILFKWDIKKDVGDLDYRKIRHSATKLTKKELKYCVDDVKIVMALMEEKAKQDGGYNKIPITKTAYVRNRCRNKCFGVDTDNPWKKYNYQKAISTLTLTEDDYTDLRKAFQGGFTHANSWRVKDVVKRVSSYDFTSSYPVVLLTEKYPVTKASLWEPRYLEMLKDDEFLEKTLNKFCCLFTIRFKNLREKFIYEHYLSKSKCKVSGKYKVDNGRIIECEEVVTTITEQDYFIIRECYDWDEKEILKFKTFVKGYLPTDFVKTIVELYKMKTELKGVEGKEVEYMNSKGDLNSLYGMCVMDIVRPENAYDDDWVPEDSDRDVSCIIEKYNKNRGRFLFYPWGVWCTAYARRNLFTGILEFGEDYVYSDTDSIKVINADNHLPYFVDYNDGIGDKIKKMCEYHNIPESDLRPKTIKGEEKPIGVWDYEGMYTRFKTLGAKRYMYTYLDKKTMKEDISLTVSGLNKKTTIPYLKKKYKDFDKIFEAFDEGLYVPEDVTGKLVHTYIDSEEKGTITDYRGVTASYYEKSSVHLEGSEYNLSIANDYAVIILDILRLKIRSDY